MKRYPPIAVELIVDAHAECGECPVWDDRRQELVWIDIPTGTIHRWTTEGEGVPVLRLGADIGSLVLDSRDGYLLATRNQIMRVDQEGHAEALVDVPGVGRASRLNDGKCDPRGRFWIGSMAYDQRTPSEGLYRVDPPATVTKLVSGIVISNGLGWSTDATTMYYIDSPTRQVDAFDFDISSGSIIRRRPFANTSDVPGVPDGMTVDAEGFIWVAFAGGARVRRYNPAGVPVQEIILPVTEVTSCEFGGPTLTDLFITTAAEGLSPADQQRQPHAGGLFVARPGATGVPPHRFAA